MVREGSVRHEAAGAPLRVTDRQRVGEVEDGARACVRASESESEREGERRSVLPPSLSDVSGSSLVTSVKIDLAPRPRPPAAAASGATEKHAAVWFLLTPGARVEVVVVVVVWVGGTHEDMRLLTAAPLLDLPAPSSPLVLNSAVLRLEWSLSAAATTPGHGVHDSLSPGTRPLTPLWGRESRQAGGVGWGRVAEKQPAGRKLICHTVSRQELLVDMKE